MCVEPDPPHGWDTSRGQLDGGTCNGFVRTYLEERGLGAPAGNPMAYHTRETLPISYALADRYALCQRWFSSVLTSTWPNRLYFHAAERASGRNSQIIGIPLTRGEGHQLVISNQLHPLGGQAFLVEAIRIGPIRNPTVCPDRERIALDLVTKHGLSHLP